MPIKLRLNGEPGTPLYSQRKDTDSLSRIADSLEEIAKCLSENSKA